MEKPEPDSLSSSSTLQALSASSSGRRSSASNSPEFEFWMVRNPSFPQPQLLTADELFVDGVLLPLQLLPQHSETPKPEEHKAESETPKPEALPEPETEPEPGPGPESLAALPGSSPVLSTSKRWRDIFRLGEKKTSATGEEKEKDKEKEKKKERKSGNGGNVTGTELNINIWPFSRSHSAGNGENRPKLGAAAAAAAAAATRKVSSAPCSRSNSTGESKSRKWPSSPGRGGGVHLGRSSPVWQVRRGGSALKNSDRNPTPVTRNADKSGKKEAVEPRRTKSNGSGNGTRTTRVLNLNVPICIGYRHHLSCRSDVSSNSAAAAGGGVSSNSSSRGQSTGGGSNSSGAAAGGGGNTGSLLNLRTIFSKKVY